MNELTILMPDDLLPKLHQVCQRRGLHMGDAVLGLIRNFIEIDEQERLPGKSLHELLSDPEIQEQVKIARQELKRR